MMSAKSKHKAQKKKEKKRKAKEASLTAAFEDAQEEKLKSKASVYMATRDDKALARLLKRHPQAVHWRDESGNTLFMSAFLWSTDHQLEKMLVDAGSDVDARNNNGDTALHLALKVPSLSSVYRLVTEWGADLTPVNAAGETPAMLFDQHNWRSIVMGAIVGFTFDNLRREQEQALQDDLTAMHEGIPLPTSPVPALRLRRKPIQKKDP